MKNTSQVMNEGDTFLNGTHSKTLGKVMNFYKLCVKEDQTNSKGVEQVVQVLLENANMN
jgi:hypothetical protein